MAEQTFFQKIGQHKRLHVRVGDTRPSAEVQLKVTSDGTYYDISDGAGHIEVSKADGSYLQSGQALNLSSGAEGRASYDWDDGELDTVGTYRCVFKISKNDDGRFFSVPENPFELVLKVE